MRLLADFLISALDLVDAQARELGQIGRHVASSAAVSFAMALVALVGICLLLAALVVGLAPHLGAAGALALGGLAALGLVAVGHAVNPWRDR